MAKIDELKHAIEGLSPADHAALRAWLEAHDAMPGRAGSTNWRPKRA